MSGVYGIIANWNDTATVIRISKETDKTVIAAEFGAWRKAEWGRETRMSREKVLARFETFDAAQAAAAAAQAAYVAHSPSVEAAKAAVRAAHDVRAAAFLAALQSEAGE